MYFLKHSINMILITSGLLFLAACGGSNNGGGGKRYRNGS